MVFAAVALGGALLVWTGLLLVNRRVEQEAEQSLTRYLSRAGLEEQLSYRRLESRVARGMFRLEGVEFTSPRGDVGGDAGGSTDEPAEWMLRAEVITLNLPAREAPGLLQNPRTFTFTEAKLSVEGLEIHGLAKGDRIECAEITVKARGEIGPRLLNAAPEELTRHLFSLRVKLRDGQYRPGPGSRAALTERLGFDPLEGAERATVARLTANASLARSSRQVTLGDVALESELLDAKAEGTADLDRQMRPKKGRGRITVRRIAPELSSNVAPLIERYASDRAEEGPFVVRVLVDEEGRVQCRVEEQ